jgi:6-phosphogluconolactonase
VLLGPYLPEDFPSQLIQPKSGRITLLLDSDAAALLPQTGADSTGRLEITR